VETIAKASGVAASLLGAANDVTRPPRPPDDHDQRRRLDHGHSRRGCRVRRVHDTRALSQGISVPSSSPRLLEAHATDDKHQHERHGRARSPARTATSGSALHNYDQAADKLLAPTRPSRRSRSTSVSLVVRVATADVTADAKTSTIASTAGGSRLSAVNGGVTVEALSANLSLARAKSSGGAIVSVTANIKPHATSEGVTRASLLGNVLEGTGNGANSVTVFAEGADLSTSVLDTATGGVVNIEVETGSNATTNPTVSATLGQSGSVIHAVNDITVRAAGSAMPTRRPDRPRAARSTSTTTSRMPTRRRTSTSPSAGRRPRRDDRHRRRAAEHDAARLQQRHVQAPPLRWIPRIASPGTRSPSPPTTAWARDSSSVRQPGQHVPAGPDQRPQLCGDRARRLDEVAPARRGLRRAAIDPLTDAITFKGHHNLVDGDSVFYFPASNDAANAVGGLTPGKRYVVNVIDEFTIKLRDPSCRRRRRCP
jgi:hypothetical protein